MFENRTAGTSKMNRKEALGYLAQLGDLRRFARQQPRMDQAYRRLDAADVAALTLAAD